MSTSQIGRAGEKLLEREYLLRCARCGVEYQDDGYRLQCDDCGTSSLLQSSFQSQFLQPSAVSGPFRYERWLPRVRSIESENLTAVFAAPELGKLVGVRDLWVAFTGYWPERGCFAESFTFKELEAAAVLGRQPAHAKPLAVASAGNTAAAFALLCTRYEMPCVIAVPDRQVERLRLATPFGPTVKILAVKGADYNATIEFVAGLCDRLGLQAEGGVRNVARRDGMATVMYSAYEAIGRLPDFYFQAVGSGSGALAVHEAATRLNTGVLPRLMLCQHEEYAPIHALWKRCSDECTCTGTQLGDHPRGISTPELTNRRPPYAIAGGIRDAVLASDGDVVAATAADGAAMAMAFESLYGIDIEPPAGIAMAGLRAVASSGQIRDDSCVLLNITGGGRRRRMSEFRVGSLELPVVEVSCDQLGVEQTADLLDGWRDSNNVAPIGGALLSTAR